MLVRKLITNLNSIILTITRKKEKTTTLRLLTRIGSKLAKSDMTMCWSEWQSKIDKHCLLKRPSQIWQKLWE